MKRALLLSLLVILAVSAFAQDTRIGLPAFGSFDQTAYDAINRQNLNTHIAIPVANVPGRGFPFQVSVGYDSINWSVNGGVWSPDVNQDGAPTWGWGRLSTTGGLSYTLGHVTCMYLGVKLVGNRYSNFAFTDSKGGVHPFNLGTVQYCPGSNLWTNSSGYSSDGVGYFFNSNSGSFNVTPPSGINTIITQVNDTNGNFVSSRSVSNVTTWTDTRGNAVLMIDSSTPGTTKYEVIDQNGGNTTLYTLTSTQYYIKTNFTCAGIQDYTSSAPVWLPTSLSLPNGQSYSFVYEQTPGSPSNYKTGRLFQMTVPTGATYEYDYGTTNGGINCSDGTYNAVARKITSDGSSNSWVFARSANGSNWNTSITYPQMPYDITANQDVYTFSGAHEISRNSYQGTSSLLQTATTVWDSTNHYPAQVTTTLPSGVHKDTVNAWSSYGQLGQVAEYDWTTGSGLGTAKRTTIIGYQGTTPYLIANLLNLVASVAVYDGTSSGTLRSSTVNTYDETGAVTSCPTGMPGHNDTQYGCANGGSGSSSTNPRGLITTHQQYTKLTSYPGTNPITTKNTYDIFGNTLTTTVGGVLQSTAAYSATTKYSAPDSVSVGSGPQSLRLLTCTTSIPACPQQSPIQTMA